MWMLIWKNISRRRNQSVLTVTITMLTVLVFVMVLGVFQTVNRGLQLSRQRLGADAILVPKYASATGGDLLFTAIPENIYMSAETLEQARLLPGVAAATPQFYSQTLDLSCCDAGAQVRIVGYDPDSDFILQPYLQLEDRPAPSADELIMGSCFDSGFLDKRYLLLGKGFQVVNQLKPTGTGMDDMYFVHMDTVRQLCLSNPYVSKDWKDMDPYSVISVIMVRLENGVNPEDFQQQVDASGINARCILTGATVSSLQSQLSVTMEMMLLLWLASALIAGLSLAGRFNALARERKKEIGLLRAMGVKKGQVFGLILGETCTMALMGGIVGSGFALICMEPVISMLKDAFLLSPSVWNASMSAFCAGCGVLLALTLGFVSAIIPAWKSASLDPQTAITQAEVN